MCAPVHGCAHIYILVRLRGRNLKKPADPSTRTSGARIPGWPEVSDLAARGAALRNLLRRCRGRLSPEEFRLSTSRSRRGHGLRQQDVAKLAGVSERWYETFERGNMRRRFSLEFVTRIADALRLDHHERASLFRLALPEVAETVAHFECCVDHCERDAATYC